MRKGKAAGKAIPDESELLGFCLADLRCLAREHQVAGLVDAWYDDHSSTGGTGSGTGSGAGSDGGRSPSVAGCPWLPHGLIFVPIEKDMHCRHVTKANWKRRQEAVGPREAQGWVLVDEVPEFGARKTVHKKDKVDARTGQRKKGAKIIDKGDADVQMLSNCGGGGTAAAAAAAAAAVGGGGAAGGCGGSAMGAAAAPAAPSTLVQAQQRQQAEQEAVVDYIEGALATQLGRAQHECEIDLLVGGSPCVNFVGNANYSRGVQTLGSLTAEDESHLWDDQRRIFHSLAAVYSRRHQQRQRQLQQQQRADSSSSAAAAISAGLANAPWKTAATGAAGAAATGAAAAAARATPSGASASASASAWTSESDDDDPTYIKPKKLKPA